MAFFGKSEKELKEWEKKYGDSRIKNWSFDFLDEWNLKLKNQDVKNRVKKIIDRFKIYLD